MRIRESLIGIVPLITGIVVYYSLAIIAILNYSEGFDVFNDLWTHLRWFEYNPDGALFFRIGNLIYGAALVLFFLSFSVWVIEASESRFRLHIIRIIGVSIAVSMIVGEILADSALMFIIGSGLSLILTTIFLVGFTMSLYRHPRFWTPSVLIFIIAITLSSYLLFIGAIDAPIREFRVIDLLVTALNQVSMCLVAFNLAKLQTN